MVRNFFFNRNRRPQVQQSAPPQSAARSGDHTEFGTLGQSLQQELKLIAQLNRLQIRCAVRERILLVLTEHLLHVEPDPQEIFSTLEKTIREVTPKLLESDPSCSPTVHSRPLPVRLYLRVAGYQQPYAFHSFTLEPGGSATLELEPVDTVGNSAVGVEILPDAAAAEPGSIAPEISTSEVSAEIGIPETYISETHTSEISTPEISTPEISTSEESATEIVNVLEVPIDQPVEAASVELSPIESSAPEIFTVESDAEPIDYRLEFAAEPSLVETLPPESQLPAAESEPTIDQVSDQITDQIIDQPIEDSADVLPEQPQADLVIDSIAEPISIETTQDPAISSVESSSDSVVDSTNESRLEFESEYTYAENSIDETTNLVETSGEAELGQELTVDSNLETVDETVAVDRTQAYTNPEIAEIDLPDHSEVAISEDDVAEFKSQHPNSSLESTQLENIVLPSISIDLVPVNDLSVEHDLAQVQPENSTQNLHESAAETLEPETLETNLSSEPESEPKLESEWESESISSGDDFYSSEVEFDSDLSHSLEVEENGSIAHQARIEDTRVEDTEFDDITHSFTDSVPPYSDPNHNGSEPPEPSPKNLSQTNSSLINSPPANSSLTDNPVTQFSYTSSAAEVAPDSNANLAEETAKIQPIRLMPDVQEPASSFDRLPLDVGEDMAQKAFRSRLTLSNVMLTGAIGLFFVVSGAYVLTRPCVLGRQCVPLQQAQQLTERALTVLQTNPSALEVVDAYDQLTQANQLLETIPFWSGSYQQAQTLTSQYSNQVEELNFVVQALTQANTAAKKSLSPPHPISVWREVQLIWREAINLLERVPTSSSVYGLAQNKLTEYQSNLDSINTRIVVEQNALDRLEAVKKAADVTDARSKIVDSADSWQQTYTSWQTILDQLQRIPQGTMAYAEAQRLSRVYQLQLETAENRRSQEERSTTAYNQAISLADQARRLDQQGQVSQAIDYWREAISTIKQVSEGTTSYNQAQSLLNSYLASLNQSEQRVKQMTLVQTVEPQLSRICSGSYTLCTYTLTTEAIRVQLTAEYDQIVIQGLRSVQRDGNFGVGADTAVRVNQFLQSLSSISESVRVPVELYSAGGVKFGTYDLNRSGYTLP